MLAVTPPLVRGTRRARRAGGARQRAQRWGTALAARGSCARAFGAGAGNAQTEVLAALLERLGVRTGIDVPRLLDAAEEVAAPLQPAVPVIDRDAITLGLSGVYSSFLAHARRIGGRYGVPAHELLREAGDRRLVGGQEDLLVDIAVALGG